MSEQVELNKMNGLSLDLAKVNLEKLKAIFPDCVSKESNGGGIMLILIRFYLYVV